MVHLTELQRKVMEFILGRMDSTGMPPTLREISAHFGWKAVGSAQDVVLALRKKGVLLPPQPGKSRQLVPAPDALRLFREPGTEVPQRASAVTASFVAMPDFQHHLMRVPVLGMVQAGKPAEAIETAGEYVPFIRQGNKDPNDFYSVVVEGYSMMNVGFLPGDYLLIESQQNAKNGDIVLAALKDHEVTVKRFAMRGSLLYRQAFEKMPPRSVSLERMPPALLVPENPDFEPLSFGGTDSDRILGLVRALYRREIN